MSSIDAGPTFRPFQQTPRPSYLNGGTDTKVAKLLQIEPKLGFPEAGSNEHLVLAVAG